MRKQIRLFLILLFSATCLLNAQQGNIYHVAKTGNLSNPGTSSAPFLNISQAAAIMQAGDTCYIKAGIYREVLDPVNHGTAPAPIVFIAEKDEEVIISATQTITDWTLNMRK